MIKKCWTIYCLNKTSKQIRHFHHSGWLFALDKFYYFFIWRENISCVLPAGGYFLSSPGGRKYPPAERPQELYACQENSGNICPPSRGKLRNIFPLGELRKYLRVKQGKIKKCLPAGRTQGISAHREKSIKICSVTQNDGKLPMTLHFFFVSRKTCGWEFSSFLCLSWFLFTVLAIYYKYFATCIYSQHFDHIFNPRIARIEKYGQNILNISGRAGHFRYFWMFSITKNDFLHFLLS